MSRRNNYQERTTQILVEARIDARWGPTLLMQNLGEMRTEYERRGLAPECYAEGRLEQVTTEDRLADYLDSVFVPW